ncbi:hypothetical protein QFZ84_001066 [Pseudomonas fluorescens]
MLRLNTPSWFRVGDLILFGKVCLVFAPVHIRIVFGHRYEVTFSFNLPDKFGFFVKKPARPISVSIG